ncbi:litaf-like zinc finger domain-containing protein [Phlyctema vagabunda]|uniref:Litaf-like zinc finger domain-containing protein n=1 Tax=Phlyctema vagabunda TaxID=108571 RepID=A0ABR4PGL2_9HELO
MASTTSSSSMNQDEFTAHLEQQSPLRQRLQPTTPAEGDLDETAADTQLDGPSTPRGTNPRGTPVREIPNPNDNGEGLEPYQAQVGPVKLAALGRKSAVVFCPKCRLEMATVVKYKIGGCTALISFATCAVTSLACFWIPLLIAQLKDVEHYCSHCGHLLGRYQLLSKKFKAPQEESDSFGEL